jgi:DNA-binding response OmpR family regulator
VATVLLVEDEESIAEVVADNLRYEGYGVLEATDGYKGLELALEHRPDLMILDLMLPGIDGYEVCRRLRDQGQSVPIIMLTAKGQEVDKVRGLDLGADDYITKPVGVMELMARVRAVLRRSGHGEGVTEGAVLCLGEARVDFSRFEASVSGEAVHLSPKEFGVLEFLWRAQGRAVARAEILQQVWGYDVYPTTRTVDTHVGELRAKLEKDPAKPRHLLTVHGVGYRLMV